MGVIVYEDIWDFRYYMGLCWVLNAQIIRKWGNHMGRQQKMT